MSAWLCNESHLYEMAHYYVENCQKYVQAINKMDVEKVVTILWEANLDSLNYRYDDDIEENKISREKLSHYRPIVTNIFHMAKLVGCYEYQSCENEKRWDVSKAKQICKDITDGLLTNSDDYESAPWGFDYDEYKNKFVGASFSGNEALDKLLVI